MTSEITEVGGRKALVVGLNDDGEPTSLQSAELVRVLYLDGKLPSAEFLVPKPKGAD